MEGIGKRQVQLVYIGEVIRPMCGDSDVYPTMRCWIISKVFKYWQIGRQTFQKGRVKLAGKGGVGLEGRVRGDKLVFSDTVQGILANEQEEEGSQQK